MFIKISFFFLDQILRICICNNCFPMQDQNISLLSFNELSQDLPLSRLFMSLDQKEQFMFNPPHPSHDNIQLYNISPEELEKGYASDESPTKKTKHKRIRKRKSMVPVREDRNRQMRAKLYIESLQNRILDLQSEVQKLRKINKLNMEYIKRLNDSQHVMNGFFIDRQKIFEKIERLTSSQGSDQRRIHLQCVSMKLKQGAFGNERIKAINYYFKQLIEMIMPNAYKYLNWAALNNIDLFNPDSISSGPCQWRKQMFNKLMLSDDTLRLISCKRLAIIDIKTKFNSKLLQMYQKKCELIQFVRQMEIILQQFNETLTPLQTGRFLCYLEKYKFENGTYLEESVRTMYEELDSAQKFSYRKLVEPLSQQ